MNPLELMETLRQAGAALQGLAVAGLLTVSLLTALIAAYLSAKAHGSGYARFSMRAVASWYIRLIQIAAVVAGAAGLAALLNVGFGAAFGAGYSFAEKVTSADYPSMVYRGVVLTGAALITYVVHRWVKGLVEPNHGAGIANRFFVVALAIGFGIASVALLFGSGISLVDYHVGAPGGGEVRSHPGRMLSGLIIALAFWAWALKALRREARSDSQPG